MGLVSDRLKLPLLAAAQAQKEVTHNEALALADIAVQAVVQAVAPVIVPARRRWLGNAGLSAQPQLVRGQGAQAISRDGPTVVGVLLHHLKACAFGALPTV